jgi:hypothetical protein
VAYIQRRRIQERTPSGRLKSVVTYRVRYRDWSGRLQSETFRRAGDAERRKAQVENELASGTWRDPRRGEIRLTDWRRTGSGLDTTFEQRQKPASRPPCECR